MLDTAYIYYKDKLFKIDDDEVHAQYVTEHYQNFGISDEQFNLLKKKYRKLSDLQLNLLDMVIQKGAIQIRNFSKLQMTMINMNSHKEIDKLIECIIDNSQCVLYKMQVTFLSEPESGGIANNIIELYEI